MRKTIYIITLFFITLMSCTSKQETISLLQFNIWQEGTMVQDGFEGIVDNIINAEADVVTFSEVRNYNNVDFINHLKEALADKGYNYYGESSTSTGIISKYPIMEQTVIYPLESDAGTITKAQIEVNGKVVVVYSAHLDYRHYSCYLPRGYDGSDWSKMDEPITDTDSILAQSRKSQRLKAIKVFIEESKAEIEKGNIVILGGDFNEPSHLDWAELSKNLWDHNGAVVEWEVSKLLADNGFADSYREMHPDIINYPGFTFPSDNLGAETTKLTWAPDADERDRIDFIYYYPNSKITLLNSIMVGPSASIVNAKRVEENTSETFLLPTGVWPTDHKAVMSSFSTKN